MDAKLGRRGHVSIHGSLPITAEGTGDRPSSAIQADVVDLELRMRNVYTGQLFTTSNPREVHEVLGHGTNDWNCPSVQIPLFFAERSDHTGIPHSCRRRKTFQQCISHRQHKQCHQQASPSRCLPLTVETRFQAESMPH